MFKRVAMVFLAIVMALSIGIGGVACNRGGLVDESLDEEGNINMNKPLVIRFAAPEGQFGDEIEMFAKGFKELYPNVTIKYEPIAGSWTEKLAGQFAAGNAPDVFWTDEVQSYASNGLLEDLNPYFEKYGVDKSDYYESMFALGEYEGGLYLMPREYNKVVVYINTQIFDTVFGSMSRDELPFTPREGTNYPANGWTWEEFVETAQMIAQKQDGNFVRRGAEISFSWGSSGPIIFTSLGGTIRSESNGQEGIDFNNSTNQAILQEIVDLVESGAFNNEILPDVGDFFSGRIGMMFNSRPATSTMEEADALSGKWDVVSFPTLPDGAIPTGASGYVLNAQSKVKELAATLLFYIISEEGQELFMETGNCIPIMRSLAEDENAMWRQYPEREINQDAFLYGDDEDSVLPYKYEFDNLNAVKNFESVWKGYVTPALLNGDMTVAEAMEYSQSQLETIFSNT